MAKLGKALMSLLLDKKARAALEAKATRSQQPQQPQQAQRQAAPRVPEPPHPSQDEIIARLDDAQKSSTSRAATPDRRKLIEEAQRVRADKAKMLDDLPEEQKRKLQAMAMMSFMKSRPGG